MSDQKELTFKNVVNIFIEHYNFLLTKWVIIVIMGLLGGGVGLTYCFLKKPRYVGNVTFAIEGEMSMGGLSSMISAIGFTAQSQGIFNLPNITEYLQSKKMVQDALLQPLDSTTQKTFAQLYIETYRMSEGWSDEPKLNGMYFRSSDKRTSFSREKDSVLTLVFNSIMEKGELKVGQKDTETSILSVDIVTESEEFSAKFPEKLIEIVGVFYADHKTKKAKLSLDILERQVDSVKLALNQSMYSAAQSTDDVFGLNPAMATKRIPTSKKQIDVEANIILLKELVKNLEVSKISYLNQTPIIHIINSPILPLEQKYLRKIYGIAIGGILFGFFTVFFLFLRRYLKNMTNNV